MIGECGVPRPFTRTILRRKLGKIAKGKAPGYSGNEPDLYASLPDAWLDWAAELANAIQLTQNHAWQLAHCPDSLCTQGWFGWQPIEPQAAGSRGGVS
jgi:hypothetical protein